MKLAIIDFNRTVYNPETGGLMPGAIEMLEHLAQKGLTMILVSRNEPGRGDALTELGVRSFFTDTKFVEEKTPELFLQILSKHGAEPRETYVLGDHLHQEIQVGNAIGAKTIHFRSGKFARLVPRKGGRPWKTITHLSEITDLF